MIEGWVTWNKLAEYMVGAVKKRIQGILYPDEAASVFRKPTKSQQTKTMHAIMESPLCACTHNTQESIRSVSTPILWERNQSSSLVSSLF